MIWGNIWPHLVGGFTGWSIGCLSADLLIKRSKHRLKMRALKHAQTNYTESHEALPVASVHELWKLMQDGGWVLKVSADDAYTPWQLVSPTGQRLSVEAEDIKLLIARYEDNPNLWLTR